MAEQSTGPFIHPKKREILNRLVVQKDKQGNVWNVDPISDPKLDRPTKNVSPLRLLEQRAKTK